MGGQGFTRAIIGEIVLAERRLCKLYEPGHLGQLASPLRKMPGSMAAYLYLPIKKRSGPPVGRAAYKVNRHFKMPVDL